MGKFIKHFFYALWSMFSTTVIYGGIAFLMWRIANPPIDPRLHSLGATLLAFFTILFSLAVLAIFVVGAHHDTQMDKYEKRFSLEPKAIRTRRQANELASKITSSVLGGYDEYDTPDQKLLKARDKYADEYKPRRFYYWTTQMYALALFVIMVACVGMAGYVKTAVWLGWTDIWWWAGMGFIFKAGKRAFAFREAERNAVVEAATGTEPTPTVASRV